MAERIGNYMESYGVRFIKEAVPTKLEKPNPDGRILVTYK
jgi:hypothetical protein